MNTSWLVAMGIDLPNPLGDGTRTLLGHRLLLVLRTGPKSMRELHAATGRRAPAAMIRAALAELGATGLATVQRVPSGQRGGRPREVWRLLYPGSLAIEVARRAIVAGRARPARRRAAMPPSTSRRQAAVVRRGRGRRPVPRTVAKAICNWLAGGRYLRDFCRRPGRPSSRTVYAWTAKDPEFRRRFQRARDFGEDWIRDGYADCLMAPAALAAFRTQRTRREFCRRYLRPIDLRLQRWRKHPRRHNR